MCMKNRGIIKFNFTAVWLMKVGICTGAIKLGLCVKGIGQGRLTPNLNARGVCRHSYMAALCVCAGRTTFLSARGFWGAFSRRPNRYPGLLVSPNRRKKSACVSFSQRSECTRVSVARSIPRARTNGAPSSAGTRVLVPRRRRHLRR